MKDNNEIPDTSIGKPTDEQLEKINKFTRRKLTSDEVYTFSVVLCDNEIDRDFERFSEASLQKMAELFVGKTGIFDHSAKSGDQCARIFETEIERLDSLTTDQKPYVRLKALAYMPKIESNKWLIDEIDAGIKKEVSVGCSMKRAVCSICGSTAPHCKHHKGKYYTQNGKNTLCYFTLEDPRDAYEWSFVAVPAQPKAGVTKSFSMGKEEKLLNFEETVKSLSLGEEVTVSGETAKSIASLLTAAEEFLKTKRCEIISSLGLNDNSSELISKALSLLAPEEIIALANISETATEEVKPQLTAKKTAISNKNGKYKI